MKSIFFLVLSRLKKNYRDIVFKTFFVSDNYLQLFEPFKNPTAACGSINYDSLQDLLFYLSSYVQIENDSPERRLLTTPLYFQGSLFRSAGSL